MHGAIRESDWKILRDLQPLLLDRLCQSILDELTAIASDADMGAHAKYGKVYGKIHERNKEIAVAFDGMSRSEALFKLSVMNRFGLLEEGELARFSKETQDYLAQMKSLYS